MGRPKKESPKQPVIDGFNAYDLPGLIEETLVGAADIFEHGPWEETKDLWQFIALKLVGGEKLFEVEARYLAAALHKMFETGDANAAFGVNRKGPKVKDVKGTMYLVDLLEKQGVTRGEAWSLVAKLDWPHSTINDRLNDPGEALRKKIERAHKKYFG